MNKSLKLDQHTFMHVKQRLDHYRLPTNFPIESTDLLSKLLALLDGHSNEKLYQKENNRYEELIRQNKQGSNTTCGISLNFAPYVNEALRLELSKFVRQNNTLHNQIITLKQQLSVQKHQQSKFRINDRTIMQTYIQQSHCLQNNVKSRQRQLFNQLEQTKYNYNMLMDLIHEEDDHKEKLYLKKLLKHKKYDLGNSYEKQQSSQQKVESSGFMVSNSKKKNQSQSKYFVHSSGDSWQLEHLRQKLANRQKQILRLQSKLQFDGINMNRVLKDFNQKKDQQAISKQNQKLLHLQKQNHKLKQQNVTMKKQGGDKQALRQQVFKLKQQNLKLSNKIQQQKKRHREVEVDQKQQARRNKRKLNQTMGKLDEMAKDKAKQDVKLQQENRKKNKAAEQRLSEEARQQTIRKLIIESEELKQMLENKQQEMREFTRAFDDIRLMNEYQKNKNNQLQAQLLDLKTKSKKEDKNKKTIQNLQEERNWEIQKLQLVKEIQLLSKEKQLIQRQKRLLSQRINNLQLANEDLAKRANFQQQSTMMLQRTQYQNNHYQQQAEEMYRDEISQLKNKVSQLHLQLASVQSQLTVTRSQLLQTQLTNQQLRGQNLSQLTQQSLQRTNMREQNSKIQSEFKQLKDRYFILQKGHKQKIRQSEQKLVDLQNHLALQQHKNQQQQFRIKSLQKELVECSDRLRQTNKQLSKLQDQLHHMRIEKSRLQRKYNELKTDYTSSQQKGKNLSVLKETQLLVQIQKISRELQRKQLMEIQIKSQMNEMTHRINIQNTHLRQLQEQNQNFRNQLDGFKHKEVLYEMEIRELQGLRKETQQE